MISASDLNKTLEHQLYVRPSTKIKFISFAKERRQETVKGNRFVLRFRLHSKVRHVDSHYKLHNHTMQDNHIINRLEKAKGQCT